MGWAPMNLIVPPDWPRAVEQPTYVKPPEWSPVGLLAVALDQSPVQLTAAVEYSELPYEDAA